MAANGTIINQDLHDNDWVGVVINSNDTTFSGRAQVRVFSVMDGIKDEHLPWASPVYPTIFGDTGAGNISIPKRGQFVRVQFNNGDIYSPEIIGIQNIDNELIKKIKDDYQGTHVLLFDPIEDLNVIYQPKSGFMIFYKESFFQITPDSMITLQHANSDSIIQMEGEIVRIASKNEVDISAAGKVTVNADEVIINGANTTKVGPGPYSHAMLAEPYIALLSTLATALDAKLPLTPGINVGLVEAAKSSFTSNNVLISI